MLFLRWRSRDVPVLDAPTFTGNLINGQTLTAGALSADLPYVQTQYQWKAAASPYTTYANISSATASTYLLTGDEIGDRIILSARVRGADGWSEWTDSAPSAIVQDSPALPLEITGTPVASALQGSPYSFTVTGLNGVPGTSPKYTFALVGAWPPGITITPNAAGDQATISGSPTTAGTFGGLSVSVSDSILTTVSTATFAINVSAAGSYPKLVPGSGWTGATAAPASRGSAANVGYGFECFLGWAVEQFPTITGQHLIEVVAGHTGPQADWEADGTPLFGMYSVEASVDNGPWVLIAPSYDASVNRWSYRFRIDAADFADGTWKTNGKREVRVRAVGKNGVGMTLQGSTDVWPYAFPGFFFSTNANGTLTTTTKYCDSAATNGDTTGDGSSGNPYRTIGKAATVVGQGGIIKLKAGSYTLNGVSSQLTDNGRWLTIRANDGVAASAVRVSGGGASSWRVFRTQIIGVTTTNPLPMNANYALHIDGSICDQGAANVRVLDNSPWNHGVSTALTYITNSSVTNFSFGPTNARLVKGCTIGTIASDVFTNCLVVLNCTVDALLAGQRESSAGVWDGGGNFHPDTFQYNRGAPTTSEYWWGAYHYNVDITTGNANAQGIFLKDVGAHNRIFAINWAFVLKINTSAGYSPPNNARNALYKQSSDTLRNSMFYNVSLTNGIKDWAGPCDDVIAINMTLTNMLGGNNSIPSSILNYTP